MRFSTFIVIVFMSPSTEIHDDIANVDEFILDYLGYYDEYYKSRVTFYLNRIPDRESLRFYETPHLFVFGLYEDTPVDKKELSRVLIELPQYNISSLVVSAPKVRVYLRECMRPYAME